MGKHVAIKVRKEVDSGVAAVKNQVHDAIWTAINNVLLPRVEMTVRCITGSSGFCPNSAGQNTDQENFSSNIENTALMTASGRIDVIDHHLFR